MPEEFAPREPGKPWFIHRLLAGFAVALTIALSAYLLFSMTNASAVWFGSLWFLALLPAVLCALICYIGDPDQSRPASFYRWVPFALVGMVDAGAAILLHEGVICTLMLSPIWLFSGWIGASLLRSQRKRRGGATLNSSFLIIPLVAGVVEAQIPPPHEQVLVSRRLLIHASPAEIWPYAVSNASIDVREGRWTISHNIIGLPRPRRTAINGFGVGAVRTAYWGDHISFEEQITQWTPGQRLGWTFHFSNTSMRDYTDQHISPDGRFLKIDSGAYTLRAISPDLTELSLSTRYIAMTHVNPYAKLWGDLLLGDVQDNILTIIKTRAEAAHVGSKARV